MKSLTVNIFLREIYAHENQGVHEELFVILLSRVAGHGADLHRPASARFVSCLDDKCALFRDKSVDYRLRFGRSHDGVKNSRMIEAGGDAGEHF